MTAAANPLGTYRKNHGRGHSYYIDGGKVDGVTTVISKGTPKTGLYNWAAREAAREAVDHWEELGQLPVMERFERISSAHNATKTQAGVKGTRVHKLAERLIAGEVVQVPEDIRGHVEACVRFLDDWEVQPLITEKPVFSRQHRYAGSPDLFAYTYGEDLPGLFDYKTSAKGPYGETAFQLAAYRYADFWLDEAGNEMPVPEVRGAYVVWLRYDGYDVIPFEAGARQFREFLYIQQTAHACEAAKDDYRLDALPPPIKAKENA